MRTEKEKIFSFRFSKGGSCVGAVASLLVCVIFACCVIHRNTVKPFEPNTMDFGARLSEHASVDYLRHTTQITYPRSLSVKQATATARRVNVKSENETGNARAHLDPIHFLPFITNARFMLLFFSPALLIIAVISLSHAVPFAYPLDLKHIKNVK